MFVALAQIAAGAEGIPAATDTETVCVATPVPLLAVKVKVRAPTSASGGAYANSPVPGVNPYPPEAVADCSASAGTG